MFSLSHLLLKLNFSVLATVPPRDKDSENKTTQAMNPTSITFISAFNYQEASYAQYMHPPPFSNSVTSNYSTEWSVPIDVELNNPLSTSLCKPLFMSQIANLTLL